MSNNSEVYPKSPLTEVVFEIRFPGEPAVECHRDELFEVIRSTFPRVRVPQPSAEDNFKFRTYQFVSQDNAFTVMAGLNSLSYSSKRYTGFSEFKAQLSPVFDYFVERFKLKVLRRVGFRYINAIPFTRENDAIPLARYLKSRIVLSPDLTDRIGLCSLGLVQDLGDGQILTRIDTARQQNGEDEALILDFDYFRTKELVASNISDYLDDSHAHAKGFFENIITAQYRDFIRGKPLL